MENMVLDEPTVYILISDVANSWKSMILICAGLFVSLLEVSFIDKL